MSAKAASSRAVAAQVLQNVLQHGRSLSAVLPELQQQLAPADRAWVQAVCFDVMRELPRYEWLIQQLVDKPLKSKVRIVHYLIMVGLSQLRTLNTPEHAALSETVNAASQVRQKALKGLINGVLRNYLRHRDALESQLSQQVPLADCFPRWMRERIQQAWPKQSDAIFNASQQRPPLWLRVNAKQFSGAEYLQLLSEQNITATVHPQLTQALKLSESLDVRTLPHFAEGAVSVQDISAQWAGYYLQTQPGMRVLDACAAPGGKSALLLEQTAGIELDALDFEESRIPRMIENFARLQLTANVIQGDAANPSDWWSGIAYDRILLDAPCSATGIMRRQPDIRWHRRESDIGPLVELQQQILTAQWQLLKPGGILVYATCSILPEENEQQIVNFLANTSDAKRADPLVEQGRQILPGDPTGEDGDGFYYAVLQKLGSS
ncbi:16S rRNA (cytosine(967)-C(5))-methyltransferase RsmB [Aliidiomarina quisquiliarum]|uniref:16S rRNA (cytosine(967)-C(5))-methyltransferase RsmB n=1 Tax=Aliidiomarina quisquiliarum TaxID=2938947 RepID=UPI00208EADE2|nr:16S rRNA (cytosine(967)-C(5))-methyltransferase RsmB [Aliidiomarina quisquiliarum]MCO4321298.1 16S rRNA (cytosine(967)-C(5))-methyltransferase RsmB [Aliidiomarina quisquiliarum]